MNFNVYPTPDFKKFFKKLYKKYPSLKSDLEELINELSESPEKGTPLGHGVFKIRMAITSKGKGKSGGARVVTFLAYKDMDVFLVYIYDKTQLDTITKQQIFELLKRANLI